MTSKLERYLEEYDGKAVSMLSEARAACAGVPGYLDDLVALCLDPRPGVADGATWILKAEVEEGVLLPSELINQIADSLNKIHSWQAKLHLCQVADKLPVNAVQANRFTVWAKKLANHPRSFLRAWGLHVTIVFGLKFKKQRRDLKRVLDVADHDQAACVRARARQLREMIDRP